MPKQGYNKDLRLLLDANLSLHEMNLDKAKEILAEICKDFPFENEQSRTHWYARLITPMVRGVMGFSTRIPLFLFMANKPRAGKDYLNGVAQTLYYGNAFEDPAILSGDSAETRKQMTTAHMAKRRSFHIANQQAFIDDPILIQAITNPKHNDRRLGSNDAAAFLSFPNELEFTMSGNVGLKWREDFTPRGLSHWLTLKKIQTPASFRFLICTGM